MTGMGLYGGVSGVRQSCGFFNLSSVYYGVKHIIICEALPLSCGFSIYVLYILQQKFIFFLKRELMRKQHNLGDVCACAKSLAGRMRCGRRIDTYSSKEERKEEKYIYVYRYMLALLSE